MSLLSSCPVELLEEILKEQREKLEWYDLQDETENVWKTLVLMEYVKIELKVRELEAEMREELEGELEEKLIGGNGDAN